MQNFFATILATIIAATGALANNAQQLSETISGHLFPKAATSVDYATERQAAAATSLPNPFGAPNFATHDDAALSSSALTLSTTSQKVQSAAPDPSSAVSNLRGNVLGTSTVTQSIIERVVEGGITQEQLTAALNGLSDQFNRQLASLPAPAISFSGPAATTPVSTATFAPSQRIDQLGNVTITNATVNGVSGLTDADLPDSLTASNYLPLTGGTLTGDLTMSGTLTAGALSVAGISSSGALIGPYVTATSTTATSTFAGGLNVAGVTGLSILQNGNAVIGTTSPTNSDAGLTIVGSNAASKILEVHNNFAVGADLYTHSDTGFRGPFISLSRSRGNQLAPSAVQTSDSLGGLSYVGYNGSAYASGASIQATPLENWTGSVQGTKLTFFTAALGQTSMGQSMTVQSTGVGINQPSPSYRLDVSGLGRFTGLVDAANFVATSTSATSTLAGGLAVETSGLVYDHATNRVGVGTASPDNPLTVVGSTRISGNAFFNYDGSANTSLTQIDKSGTSNASRIVGFDSSGNIGYLLNANGNSYFSGGNVGIGTTSPTSMLNIAGATPKLTLTDTGAGSNLKHWFVQSNAGALRFATTSDALTDTSLAAFTIASDGTVGVGVSSPIDALEVARNLSSTAGTFRSVLSLDDDTPFVTGVSSSGAGMRFRGQTNFGRTTIAGIWAEHDSNSNTKGRLYFMSRGGASDDGSLTPDMVLMNDRLGIGTTSPYAKLSVTNTGSDPSFVVEDDTSPDSTPFIIDASGNVGIGTTTPTNKFVVSGTTGIVSTNVTARPYTTYDYDNGGSIKWTMGYDPAGTSNDFSITNIYSGTRDVFHIENTAPANALRIQASTGNVGIGTTTPAAFLNIYTNDSIASPNPHFRLSGTGGKQLKMGYDSTSNFGWIQTVDAGVGFTDLLLNTSGGDVGVGTTSPWRKLSVTGTVGFDGLTGATGAGSLCLDSNKQVVYNSASDNCLSSTRATKHDISPLTIDALAQVLALQPVSFVYNEGDGRTRYGFIAEDTAAVDAHLATYNASGTVSGIDDRSIIAILVSAIKDLASKIAGFAQSFSSHFIHGDTVEANMLCVGDVCVTRDQFAEVFGNKSAAAGTPATTGVSGAPSGPSAAGSPSADDGSITPEDDSNTTASSTPEIGEAANDNQPVIDDENEPEAPDVIGEPTETELEESEPPAEPREEPAPELITPEPANDNPPPSEILPATGTE